MEYGTDKYRGSSLRIGFAAMAAMAAAVSVAGPARELPPFRDFAIGPEPEAPRRVWRGSHYRHRNGKSIPSDSARTAKRKAQRKARRQTRKHRK